jgi:hypothetical protein
MGKKKAEEKLNENGVVVPDPEDAESGMPPRCPNPEPLEDK